MASLAMKMVVMIMINMVVVGVINYKSTQFRLFLICALHHQKSDLQYFGNKKLLIALYFLNGVVLWGVIWWKAESFLCPCPGRTSSVWQAEHLNRVFFPHNKISII